MWRTHFPFRSRLFDSIEYRLGIAGASMWGVLYGAYLSIGILLLFCAVGYIANDLSLQYFETPVSRIIDFSVVPFMRVNAGLLVWMICTLIGFALADDSGPYEE